MKPHHDPTLSAMPGLTPTWDIISDVTFSTITRGLGDIAGAGATV